MRFILRSSAALGVAVLVILAGGEVSRPAGAEPPAAPDLGVGHATRSPVIDNPCVAFATLERAVYEGSEYDPDTKETVKVRMVVTVRDTPGSVAGLQVTVGDVFEQERAPAWKLELIRRVAR